LYQYVRWQCINTGSKYNKNDIYGTDGVIQSIDVLLRWMEEDPVDTWEMGRNDAVQSITGTRNVFVDYPEYAWLLFGREIPNDMVTPSGIAEEGTVTPPASSEDSSSSVESSKPDSSSEESSSEFDSSEESSSSENSSEEEVCEHEFSQWIVTKQPTETEEGEQRRMCMLCGEGESEVIPKLCNHEFSKWIVTKQPTETEDGEQKRVCMLCGEGDKEVIPALGGEGSVTPETSVEDGAEDNSSDNSGGNAIMNVAGCSSMAGTSMGGILITLACCVAVEKMRKKKMK
jgi:ribosomal protein S14